MFHRLWRIRKHISRHRHLSRFRRCHVITDWNCFIISAISGTGLVSLGIGHDAFSHSYGFLRVRRFQETPGEMQICTSLHPPAVPGLTLVGTHCGNFFYPRRGLLCSAAQRNKIETGCFSEFSCRCFL